jgi:4-amino-4-deoxy-L-arabinose transferase-like glycosyltransferase
VLWALLAGLTQHTPPLDTVEWVCWGREWQLGYHKHPPLGAWMAELAFRLTPGSFAGVYLLSYACVGAAAWCAYGLARRVLPPRDAVLAAACLEGLVFFGRPAAEFSNAVPFIALWAAAVLLFHRACEADRWRDWVGLGLALGLALLCKYSAVFLVAPLLAVWLWRNGAGRLSRPAVVALVAALVFLPHFVWLCRNDFPTVRYALSRTRGESGALDHHLSGLSFLLSQGLRLLPVLLILLPVLAWRPRRVGARGARDRAFLAAAVGGPVLLHLAASLLLGMALRDIWGSSLWTFAGVLLLHAVETRPEGRAWRRAALCWAIAAVVALLGSLAANLAGSALGGRPARIHYPGPELSRAVAGRWQERFGGAPAVVAGDWWLAGNVCCHAAARPTLYGSLEPAWYGLDLAKEAGDPRRFASPEPRAAPWTGDADLLRRGGVLVWDADCYGDALPAWLRARFPTAVAEKPLALPCAGGGPTIRVGWAMAPPTPDVRTSTASGPGAPGR